MKLRKLYLTISLSTLIVWVSVGQTGPGGVGSSANVSIWLDASELNLSNGDVVTEFTDISGNGSDFTILEGSPTFLTNQINALPSVSFNGTSDCMSANGIGQLNGATEMTWFTTSMASVGNQNGCFLSSNFSGANNNLKQFCRILNNQFQSAARVSASYVNQQVSYTAGYNIICSRWNMGDGSFNSRKNNTQYSSSTSAASSNGNHLRTTIGRNSNNSNGYLNGKIAEVILFNSYLNLTQFNLVNNYLAAKYNLTIANDKYNFKVAHGNEVAGIGQESATDNHFEAQGTSIVLINNPSDANDGEYMLWGHDNGDTISDATEVPAAAPGALKLTREWRMDKTGDLGTVDVSFDLTDWGGFGGTDEYYQIWTDADGDFTSGVNQNSAIAPSIAGSVITFNGVSFNDGDYFTIANLNSVAVCRSDGSGDWSDQASINWDCGAPPDSLDVAIIDVGDAIDITGAESVDTLTISGSLNIKAGGSLKVLGDLEVQAGGSLTMVPTSTIIFKRQDIAQTFTNNSGSTVVLDNLTIQNPNGVALSGDAFELNDGLNLNNGTLTNSASSFTFISNASQTSHVNPVHNGAALSGNYTVQRFRSSRTNNWGDIASSGVATDIEDLDNEIYISGIPGGDGNAGGFVSFWYWDETSHDWASPTSTADAFEIGRGYEVWLADDMNQWNDQAWDLNGTIDMSAASIDVTNTGDKWNLIGNPYPSFLDWDAVKADNSGIVNGEFWCYDADADQWQNYTTGYVYPGQGMWIVCNSTSVNIDPENHISSGTNTSTYYKNSETLAFFNLKFSRVDHKYGTNVILRSDENASIAFDSRDISALKLPDSKACNLSINFDEAELLVNYVPTVQDTLEVPLTFRPNLEGEYVIEGISSAEFDQFDCVQLHTKEGNHENVIDISYGQKIILNFNNAKAEYHYKLVMRKSNNAQCNSEPLDLEEASVIWANEKTVRVDFPAELSEPAQIEVYNLLGDRIYFENYRTTSTKKTISLENQPLGIYLVNIIINGQKTTQKILLK